MSVTQGAPPAQRKEIWEQRWFKWCEVMLVIWGILTLVYAGVVRFSKFAPVANTDAPRWVELILTYFCIPVAVLGLYTFCIALVG